MCMHDIAVLGQMKPDIYIFCAASASGLARQARLQVVCCGPGRQLQSIGKPEAYRTLRDPP